MKQFSGFKSEAPATKYPMLPAGTYVAGIKNVKVDGKEPDQQLVLRLDIIEGDWAGYYTKRYEHDGQNARDYQAKYKGDFRIQIPDPANPKRQHPEWDTKAFNNAMWAIEQSNPGYKWDWNEGGLKGKIVGINVREGSYNGNAYTQIGRLEVADDVRKGIVSTMRPKEPRMGGTESQPVDTQSGYFIATEEVPF
jgi:hypothetical protein